MTIPRQEFNQTKCVSCPTVKRFKNNTTHKIDQGKRKMYYEENDGTPYTGIT